MTRKWSTIKVPQEILPKLSELRARTNKPNWQILVEALSFYESALRSSKHFSQSPEVDKLAYYIMKLVTSATYFKLEPSEENLQKFIKVVEQVQKRLNISCEELLPAAEKLIKQPSGRNVHTLNMAVKNCIIKMFEKMISG